MIDNSLLAKARSALTVLYDDTADVSRVSEIDNVIEFGVVHQGIKCHLSLDSSPVINQGEQVATADSQFTLYCPPDTDIQEGDRLKVTHMGESSEYDVGTVHVYNLNRLCRCTKKGVL